MTSESVISLFRRHHFMENKKVGWLLIGISLLIMLLVFLFGNTTKDFLEQTCPYIQSGLECPAYDAIDHQTFFALIIVGVLFLVGIFLISSKPEEKIIIKKMERKAGTKKLDLSGLTKEEKEIFQIIQSNKAIFQAELIEKTSIGKVKISRILDRLEGHGLIERKRRGMNNVVVLKNN